MRDLSIKEYEGGAIEQDQEDDRNKGAEDLAFLKLTVVTKLSPAVEIKSPDFRCQQKFYTF